MKVLIVMHSSNTVYGAAKSLQKLIQNSNWDIDIIYPNSFFHPVGTDIISEYSGIEESHIHRLFLPFRRRAVYDEPFNLKEALWEAGKRIFEWSDYFKLKRIVRKGEYDYVLLNSIVLYPIVNISHNIVVYVREMVNMNSGCYKKILKSLQDAKKVIFIDKAITRPFEQSGVDYRVINNPFDMSMTCAIDPSTEKASLGIDESYIIVSILGTVSPDKGIDFLVKAFSKLERHDILLLVVGKGNKEYYDYCISLSHHSNVMFLGELGDIYKVYAISDYIIRADLFFATGRTVFEGLYSGCDVIMQKDKDSDVSSIAHYDKFKDNIHFYNTRDENSLIELLNQIKKPSYKTRKEFSNIQEYISQINEYID